MKKNRISAEQYDFSQFTRNVRVYVGFTDDEEEESEEVPHSVKTKKQTNIKTPNIPMSPKVDFGKLSGKPEKEKLTGRKRPSESETAEKEKLVMPTANKAKRSFETTTALKPTGLRSGPSFKISEKDIFNKDFQIDDLVIPKKAEFKDKVRFEVTFFKRFFNL
jgi:hypothetical protein